MARFEPVSTKAKRSALAKSLKQIAVDNDATTEITESASALCLRITKGPYRVGIELNGKSQCDALLAHWYVDFKTDACYPADFGYTIHGSINPYHFRKATTCDEDVSLFLESIANGLAALNAAF